MLTIETNIVILPSKLNRLFLIAMAAGDLTLFKQSLFVPESLTLHLPGGTIPDLFKLSDDIKLFAKNEKELKSLIQTIRIYSKNIGMEFGEEKCAMLIMKSEKKKKQREEENCRIKKESKGLERKKIISSREYWNYAPTNKER